MKLKHIALIGSLFPILFSLVLFFGVLISADSDDENSNFSSGITGMNLSEAPEDSGRSLITVVLTGSLAFEVVAVAGRLTSFVFSALGFGMIEVRQAQRWVLS